MEPVTTREWELLVKTINDLKDMVEEKLSILHVDMSGERIKVATLQEQYKTITGEVMNLKESGARKWEKLVLPIMLIILAFLLPHIQWKS